MAKGSKSVVRRIGPESEEAAREPDEWVMVQPLAKAVTIPGGSAYLKSEDGRFVIFASRYRHGDRSFRTYTDHYRTIEYLEGSTYATGGRSRDLYDGTNLDKAKRSIGKTLAEVSAREARETAPVVHDDDHVTSARMFSALFLAISEGSEDNVGDFEDDPRAPVIEAALGRVGIEIESILGFGSFGVAARSADGKVVKLTADSAEVQVGAAIVGKDLPHVVAVYGAWFIRGVRVNAVVDFDEEQEEYIRKSMRVGLLVEQLVSTKIQDHDRNSLTKLVYDFKEETGNRFRDYAGLSAQRKREKLFIASQDLQLILENENFSLAQDVASALDELREVGIYAIDVHGKNVGYDEAARRYRVFDVGVGSPPPDAAKPDVIAPGRPPRGEPAPIGPEPSPPWDSAVQGPWRWPRTTWWVPR